MEGKFNYGGSYGYQGGYYSNEKKNPEEKRPYQNYMSYNYGSPTKN
jgi:hypothetical protein